MAYSLECFFDALVFRDLIFDVLSDFALRNSETRFGGSRSTSRKTRKARIQFSPVERNLQLTQLSSASTRDHCEPRAHLQAPAQSARETSQDALAPLPATRAARDAWHSSGQIYSRIVSNKFSLAALSARPLSRVLGNATYVCACLAVHLSRGSGSKVAANRSCMYSLRSTPLAEHALSYSPWLLPA